MVNGFFHLLIRFFFKTGDIDEIGGGNTENDTDNGETDSPNGGLLSSVIDWLSSIVTKIASLPSLIFDKFKDSLSNIASMFSILWEKLGELKDAIGGFFADLVGNIKGFFGDLIENMLTIPETIGDFIKDIFVPDKDETNAAFDRLRGSFDSLLVSYDLKSLVGSSKPIGDISVTLYGQKMVLLRSEIVLKGINAFRSVIRGFLVLMLVLFNINQFLGFIGQPAISIIGGINAHEEVKGGGNSGNA